MYLYILVISFLPFPLWPFAFMGFGILAIAIEGILKRAVERGSLAGKHLTNKCRRK